MALFPKPSGIGRRIHERRMAVRPIQISLVLFLQRST